MKSERSVLEIPPELYRRNIPLDRRDLFKLAGLVGFTLACSPKELPLSPAIESENIRRTEGRWTKGEVIHLASMMRAETEFNEIAYAGDLLLRNQQGQRSFSELSSLFTDDRVSIITSSQIPVPGLSEHFGAIAGAVIEETGPLTQTVLRPKSGSNNLNIVAPSKLQFTSLGIHAEDTKDVSDFALKFLVAKEIYNVRAFDLVSEVFINFMTPYQVPEDERLRNAARLYFMRTVALKTYSEMPLSFMADAWAYYLMMPNFLLAKEKGKFTPEDLNALYSVEVNSRLLLQTGIIEKKESGKYEWMEDSDRLYGSWFEAAARFHAALSGIKPPETP